MKDYSEEIQRLQVEIWEKAQQLQILKMMAFVEELDVQIREIAYPVPEAFMKAFNDKERTGGSQESSI